MRQNKVKPRLKKQPNTGKLTLWECRDDEPYKAVVAYGYSPQEAYEYWKSIKDNRHTAVAYNKF